MSAILRSGEFLASGTVYTDLDDAMHAASCLCSLHPEGATVYGTSDPAAVLSVNGEAYQVACLATRADGSTWPVPPAPYVRLYIIRKAREDES